MNGLSFMNDPWILRRNQVLTFILIWKNVPFIRRCLDLNIVKKVAEYVKIDLSGGFKISETGRIWFRYIVFTDHLSNYYGWFAFDNGSGYYRSCNVCLRPKCDIHEYYHPTRVYKAIKDISKYREKFEFDVPIKEK